MSRIIKFFQILLSIKNNSLAAHFALRVFFDNFNFWHTLLPKIMPNFWWTKYNDFLQVCWFLAINLAFYDPPSLKFHNRNDIELIKKLNAIWEKTLTTLCSGWRQRSGLLFWALYSELTLVLMECTQVNCNVFANILLNVLVREKKNTQKWNRSGVIIHIK